MAPPTTKTADRTPTVRLRRVLVLLLLTILIWRLLIPAVTDPDFGITGDVQHGGWSSDFAAILTQVKALWAGDAGYDVESHLRITSERVGRPVQHALPPAYPPTILWILGPLCVLPAAWAYVLWTLLGIATIWWMAGPRWSIWLVAVFFSPVAFSCFKLGQTSVLTAAGFLFLMSRDLDREPVQPGMASYWIEAAVLWALVAKPPFAVTASVALLAGRHWQPVALASGLTVVSLVLLLPRLGIAWVPEYAHIVTHYDLKTADPAFTWSLAQHTMGNLRALLYVVFELGDAAAGNWSRTVWLATLVGILVAGVRRQLPTEARWAVCGTGIFALLPTCHVNRRIAADYPARPVYAAGHSSDHRYLLGRGRAGAHSALPPAGPGLRWAAPFARRVSRQGPARRPGLAAMARVAFRSFTHRRGRGTAGSNVNDPVVKSHRTIRLLQAAVGGLALGALVTSVLIPAAYTQDLQVEYLTAWALRDGVDIFTPLTELSARYFPVQTENFPHPTPYPPLVALLSLPLTLLPFSVVAPLWLLANVGLLIVIGRWLKLSMPTSLMLAAWPPLWCLLSIGQLELLILASVMLGWRAAAAGQDLRAGFWLGLPASLKFYPVLLLIPFVVLGRGRLVLTAGLVFALFQLGNVLTVGPAGLLRYYVEILPPVSAMYIPGGLNASPYAALLRLFGGAFDVLPIAQIPDVVLPITIVLSVFALLALLRLAPQAAPTALLVAVCQPCGTITSFSPYRRSSRCCAIHVSVLPRCWQTVAASAVLPLVNLSLGPLATVMAWMAAVQPSMAALLAIQPLGFLALLALSLFYQRAASPHH